MQKKVNSDPKLQFKVDNLSAVSNNYALTLITKQIFFQHYIVPVLIQLFSSDIYL